MGLWLNVNYLQGRNQCVASIMQPTRNYYEYTSRRSSARQNFPTSLPQFCATMRQASNPQQDA